MGSLMTVGLSMVVLIRFPTAALTGGRIQELPGVLL